jgi:uncharacterized RDD family membrane protein YckC
MAASTGWTAKRGLKKSKQKRQPGDETSRFSRSLVTPEGVDLGVRIASAGERAGAFLIDGLIIVGVLTAMSIFLAMAGVGGGGKSREVAIIVWLIGFFVLRNFYFMLFELGARAATPGKRAMKIRVASRSGGVLRGDAIFARNAMREVEFFLPVSLLASNLASGDDLIGLAGLLWTGVFLFMPLFNRDRLRAGDIAAGSWVVQAPRTALLPDLAAQPADVANGFTFTPEQLEAYGIKELHVLEDVLRRQRPDTIKAVAARIRAKIGWARSDGEQDAAFLRAYYAALRRRLEANLLMGVRRKDKHDRSRDHGR